jgi:hypothetical protein
VRFRATDRIPPALPSFGGLKTKTEIAFMAAPSKCSKTQTFRFTAPSAAKHDPRSRLTPSGQFQNSKLTTAGWQLPLSLRI